MMIFDSATLRPLLQTLPREIRALVGQTQALARAEASEATRSMRTALIGLVAGVALVIGGLFVTLSALVLIVIALGLPAWAAATLVAVVLTAGGGTLVWWFSGLLSEVDLTLPRTRRSVSETVEWLKAGAE
jgi:hypothetical protein